MKAIGQIISMLGYILFGIIARKNGIDGATFWALIGCLVLAELGTFIKYGFD